MVVFCSYGDNITPPQQALNWIADVYPSDLALRSAGRTIVYLQHASIGHLGIFVSGKVARREHRQLLGAIDAIALLSPGLYELMIDDLPASPVATRRIRYISNHDVSPIFSPTMKMAEAMSVNSPWSTASPGSTARFTTGSCGPGCAGRSTNHSPNSCARATRFTSSRLPGAASIQHSGGWREARPDARQSPPSIP